MLALRSVLLLTLVLLHTFAQPLSNQQTQCTFPALEQQLCPKSTPTTYIKIAFINLPSLPTAPQHARFVDVAAQRPGNENGFVSLENGPWEITGVGNMTKDEAVLSVRKNGDGVGVLFRYKGTEWGSWQGRGEFWCTEEAWTGSGENWGCGKGEGNVYSRVSFLRLIWLLVLMLWLGALDQVRISVFLMIRDLKETMALLMHRMQEMEHCSTDDCYIEQYLIQIARRSRETV
jgi:hypothetical protein